MYIEKPQNYLIIEEFSHVDFAGHNAVRARYRSTFKLFMKELEWKTERVLLAERLGLTISMKGLSLFESWTKNIYEI